MPSLQPHTLALTRKEALHLVHRVTVAHNKTEIDFVAGQTAGAVLSTLLGVTVPTPSPPIDPGTNATFYEREELTNGANPGLLRFYMRNWWNKQMIESPAPIVEKMVLFYHTHFTNDDAKVTFSFPLYHQNALIRKYALGNFKTLAKKMCRDSAMSVFLDGWTNTVADPNENFAREFLELYSIGKGEQIAPGNYTTYTEDDVREAARVLTGFVPFNMLQDANIPAGYSVETDPDTGYYYSSIVTPLHDAGTKNFSSAFQNTSISTGSNTIPNIEAELDAFIDMIFDQEETAKNICRKLYRFFVYYDITPEIETDIIGPMATTFINNNFEIAPVLQELLQSKHFFDADDAIVENNNIGGIIKSPAEFLNNTFKYFNIGIGDSSNWAAHHEALGILSGAMAEMDMDLFRPPEVAGYPAYHQTRSYNRNWISGTTLIGRYGSVAYLVAGVTLTNLTLKLDTVEFVENANVIPTPNDPNSIVDTLTNDLFPNGVDATKYTALKNLLTDGDPDSAWTNAWDLYDSGGNDATVRVRLDALFNSILQSPEFQLS